MAKAVKLAPKQALSADPIDPVRELIEQARALIESALAHQHNYNDVISNQVGRLVLLREVISLTRGATSEHESLRKALCNTWLNSTEREPFTCPGYSVAWYGQEKSFPAKAAHVRTDYIINVNRLVPHAD